MYFPISGVHIPPLELILTGFLVGVLGGFFGVGGSFLAGPALFVFGVPMNFVVGTDLAHLVGKSIVAARKHHLLGHIDFKLGGLMMIGTVPGVELGAQAIQALKRAGHVQGVVGAIFIAVLVSMAGFMSWEGWRTARARRAGGGRSRKGDYSAFGSFTRRIQRAAPGPHLALPVSGIERISLWSILGVALVGGFFSGFLGGGAGYIRMPSMIYLLGIPTHVAVGTDLFEVIVSAGYGTFSHALKGNVDILIALVMHTGAAIGAQLGANLTQLISGPRIRLAFVPLLLLGAAMVLHGLLGGRPGN
ncbi:MAG TPA: sulfite exporter TauE/SafE family protein [Opitutaceae bacterium]|nr:sulfite exporter TauE/SafE family protein [Opitutaceae bacterium]